MDQQIIQKIIDAANQAPSGGNSQPWKFKVIQDSIEVIAHPEKDHPILNFRHRGTYLAHGALMENVKLAAQFFGYEASFELFPQEGISVRIHFQPSATTTSPDLYEAIAKRHTNRKPYTVEALTEEKKYLFQEAHMYPECELLVVEGEKISQAAQHLPLDMIVFLQNKLLHKLLFKEILWKEEMQHQHSGLYFKTLEAAGPKALALRLFGNWKVSKFFHKLNIPKKIHEENAGIAAKSSLLGAIAVRNDDSAFIHAGRLMENIWVRAAKLDLSFQIMTGVVFLWQQINYGDHELFSEKERNIVNQAYEQLAGILNAKDKIIALTFRVGKADEPLAVSHKRPAEIEWQS